MAVRETTEIKIGEWRGVHALFVREQKPMHTHKQLSQFYPFIFLSNHNFDENLSWFGGAYRKTKTKQKIIKRK